MPEALTPHFSGHARQQQLRRAGTASGADIRAGQELRIPVKGERVTVKKQPVVKEEVRVGKRTVTETARVAGKVRKEKVAVEKQGDVDVRSCPPGRNRGKAGK
jgi:stress response protein YsnF